MTKKSFTATWLGDEDPTRQTVEIGGQVFTKGQPLAVTEENTRAHKIMGNPMFAIDDKKAEAIASDEPEVPDVEAGTELAAAKEEARRLGIEVKGNPSLETVRGKIAAKLAE